VTFCAWLSLLSLSSHIIFLLTSTQVKRVNRFPWLRARTKRFATKKVPFWGITEKSLSLRGCHTGSFCNVLNLGLGAVCAVSAGKVEVAGPAKDDFADAAVSHRTDVSSGLRSDRPRSDSWCARLIKRVRCDSDWSASAYKYDGGKGSLSFLSLSSLVLVLVKLVTIKL
jgi:hypothetical protein